MSGAVYLETSAVLRAELEGGLAKPDSSSVSEAEVLITSRLSLVEASRVFYRLRLLGSADETRLADAERSVQHLWTRCEIWEIEEEVCQLARAVAPLSNLRALDALHLATFLLARRRIEGLTLISTDDRLIRAAATC